MATVLLTGGRAPATLDLARLFARAGHRVIAAESVRWPLTRWSRAVAQQYHVPPPRPCAASFAGALLDIVRRACVDLVVPTCEEVFHLARERAGLDGQTAVFTAPFDQLRRLHSKYTFIEAVRQAGLDAPVTVRIRSIAEACAQVKAAPGALVFKPEFSRFATRVVMCPRTEDDLGLVEASPAQPWVAQAFVAGTPVCTYAVAHEGRLTAFVAYGVRYTAGLASTIHFSVCDDARVEEWVRQFVAAERLTGQVAFDLVLTADAAVMPLECNPRATSGIHLFADQPALAQAFLDPDGPCLHAAPRQPRMLAIPMLAFGAPQAWRHGTFRRFLSEFAASRDAVFRWDDPLPAAGQPFAMLDMWRLARRHRRPMLAATTADIEYNGEDLCASS